MGFIVTLMFSLSIDIYLKEQGRRRLPERKALLTRSILDRQNMRGHCMTVNIHFFSFLEKKLSWQICKIFFNVYSCVCVCLWPEGGHGGQQKAWDSQQLKLQAIVSHSAWVLGSKSSLEGQQAL